MQLSQIYESIVFMPFFNLGNPSKQLRLGKHQFEDMVRTYNPLTLYIHSGFWSIDSLLSYDSIDLINSIYHASVNDHAEHFPRLINEDSILELP